MYDLHDYARMIADEARMGPYVRALEAVVKPGSVVVDVGAGTGIFSLIACRLGARRVYAIETNDLIEVGRELARENGVADRIVFFHKDAREVELPERADVIVSDLRGALPLYGEHLAIVADVRERFLKPDGVLVPARDRLMVGVVENSEVYERAVGPTRGPLELTLEAMRTRLHHAPFDEGASRPIRADDLLSTAGAWASLDYRTVNPVPVAGRVDIMVRRTGTGHGLVVWFEAVLASGEGFSAAPGPGLCYRSLFLPWPRPFPVSKGDSIAVDLWAQASGHPWGWNTSVGIAGSARQTFKQSSFLSDPSRPAARSLSVGQSAVSQSATAPR